MPMLCYKKEEQIVFINLDSVTIMQVCKMTMLNGKTISGKLWYNIEISIL